MSSSDSDEDEDDDVDFAFHGGKVPSPPGRVKRKPDCQPPLTVPMGREESSEWFDVTASCLAHNDVNLSETKANAENCRNLYPAQFFSADNSRLTLLEILPSILTGSIGSDRILS